MSSSYSVTGSDLNSLTGVIEKKKLIDQNEVIVRTIQEFRILFMKHFLLLMRDILMVF